MVKKQTTNRRDQQILSLYAQKEKPVLKTKISPAQTKTAPLAIKSPFVIQDLIRSLFLSILIIVFQLILYWFFQ